MQNNMNKSRRVLHRLKIHPTYFFDVKEGIKTFEVRYNDRNFKVGDFLLLREYVSCYHDAYYTGSFLYAKVTYILTETSGYLKPGYVVLGIKVI